MAALLTSQRITARDISNFFADVVGSIDAGIGRKENKELFTMDEIKRAPLVFEEEKILVLLQDAAILLAEQSSYSSLLIFFALIQKFKNVVTRSKLPVARTLWRKTQEMLDNIISETDKFVAALEEFVSDEAREKSLVDILGCREHNKSGIVQDSHVEDEANFLAKQCYCVDYFLLNKCLEINANPFPVPLLKDKIKEERVKATAAALASKDDVAHPPASKKARKEDNVNNNDQ